MDAIEREQPFGAARDDRRIDVLIPQRRRYVSRRDFVASSRDLPVVDLDAFRADQEATLEPPE